MENLWILFALLSALAAAFVAIFAKIGLEKVDANTATAIRAVIMAIVLILVVTLEGKLTLISTIFANHKALFWIFMSGVAGALSWIFYFLALKIGKASQVATLDRLSIVFVILLSLLILGEKFSWKVGVGAALVTVGAIIITIG